MRRLRSVCIEKVETNKNGGGYGRKIKNNALSRLVQLVTDNVPSADHLADGEDAVRLDGVKDPTLVLTRLVQLLPEREVRSLLGELADCGQQVGVEQWRFRTETMIGWRKGECVRDEVRELRGRKEEEKGETAKSMGAKVERGGVGVD